MIQRADSFSTRAPQMSAVCLMPSTLPWLKKCCRRDVCDSACRFVLHQGTANVCSMSHAKYASMAEEVL